MWLPCQDLMLEPQKIGDRLILACGVSVRCVQFRLKTNAGAADAMWIDGYPQQIAVVQDGWAFGGEALCNCCDIPVWRRGKKAVANFRFPRGRREPVRRNGRKGLGLRQIARRRWCKQDHAGNRQLFGSQHDGQRTHAVSDQNQGAAERAASLHEACTQILDAQANRDVVRAKRAMSRQVNGKTAYMLLRKIIQIMAVAPGTVVGAGNKQKCGLQGAAGIVAYEQSVRRGIKPWSLVNGAEIKLAGEMLQCIHAVNLRRHV